MPKTEVDAPDKGNDQAPDKGNPDNVDWQKRYADSTRGAQKLNEENKALREAAERKESLAIKTIVQQAIIDPGYLQTVAAEDKELADKVSQQLRPKNGGKSFSNFEEFMQYASSSAGQQDSRRVSDAPAGFSKEEIVKELMHEMTKKEIEKLVASEIDKVPEDKREAVKAKYELFAGKRQLSADEAKAFISDAKAVVYATSGGNVDELIAKMASTTTKSSDRSKDNAPRASTKELAERLGMGYLFKEKK